MRKIEPGNHGIIVNPTLRKERDDLLKEVNISENQQLDTMGQIKFIKEQMALGMKTLPMVPVNHVDRGLEEDIKACVRPKKETEEYVLVKAQNVHDYFYRHREHLRWDDFDTFTASRPPYPKMGISYDAYSYEGNKRLPDIHTCVLVKEVRVEHSNSSEVQEFIDRTRPFKMLFIQTTLEGVEVKRWLIVGIDESGKILHDPKNDNVYIDICNDGRKGEHFQNIIHRDAALALATINFMNCKNVEIIDNAPKAKHVRRALERGERPPVSFKTLRIMPFGRAARQKDKAQQASGIEMPLHICRGHFKDYRQSANGLGRGHARGMWWWSPQLRGKESAGKVVKDYSVEPMRDE